MTENTDNYCCQPTNTMGKGGGLSPAAGADIG